jgi:hypothetical protein
MRASPAGRLHAGACGRRGSSDGREYGLKQRSARLEYVTLYEL